MGYALLEIDLGVGFTVTQIVAGHYHTCALSTSDALKCWGYNGYGQLGYGDTDWRGDGAKADINNIFRNHFELSNKFLYN